MLRLGNAEKAAAETGIKADTIRRLRSKHPVRYRVLSELHAHAREAAAVALVSGLLDDAEFARETLRKGMRGEASREQISAAKAVVDCLAVMDKAVRLDENRATEIVETRQVADIDAELARVCAEVEAQQ